MQKAVHVRLLKSWERERILGLTRTESASFYFTGYLPLCSVIQVSIVCEIFSYFLCLYLLMCLKVTELL